MEKIRERILIAVNTKVLAAMGKLVENDPAYHSRNHFVELAIIEKLEREKK